MTSTKPTRVERARALHDAIAEAAGGTAAEPFAVFGPALEAANADLRDVVPVLVDFLTAYEGDDTWGDDEAGAALVLRQLVHVYSHRNGACGGVWGDVVQRLAVDISCRFAPRR